MLQCSVCVLQYSSANHDPVHITERLHLRRDTLKPRLRRPYNVYIEQYVFGIVPHHLENTVRAGDVIRACMP